MNFPELLITCVLFGCTFSALRDEIVGQIFYRQELGLTEVPTDIPNSTAEVHLDSNSITHLTTGVFSNLPQCTSLNLQENVIRSIDVGAFNGLSNLDKLDLSSNRMKVLEQGMFDGTPHLRVLNIYNNDIHAIPAGCFSNLGELETLYMASNDFSTLNGDMWLGLKSLSHLDLQYNPQMQVIPPGGLSNLPKLRLLHLHNNGLKTLTNDIFTTINDCPNSNGHPPILKLSLRANPLVCHTKLCWLKKGEEEGWLTYPIYSDIIYSPNCANGVDWNNLQLNCSDSGKFHALISENGGSLLLNLW